MSFLSLDGVTKRFDGIVAVDGVSFRVDPGQVVGFLGPNGAGKSTTMRMIWFIALILNETIVEI